MLQPVGSMVLVTYEPSLKCRSAETGVLVAVGNHAYSCRDWVGRTVVYKVEGRYLTRNDDDAPCALVDVNAILAVSDK